MDDATVRHSTEGEAVGRAEGTIALKRRLSLDQIVATWWPPGVFLIVLLAAWEFIAPRGWLLNPVLLPPPMRSVKLLDSSSAPRTLRRTLYGPST